MEFLAWMVLCICCASTTVICTLNTGRLLCLWIMVIPLFCTPSRTSTKDEENDDDKY